MTGWLVKALLFALRNRQYLPEVLDVIRQIVGVYRELRDKDVASGALTEAEAADQDAQLGKALGAEAQALGSDADALLAKLSKP